MRDKRKQKSRGQQDRKKTKEQQAPKIKIK